ncbi:hypothetical protein ACET81_21625 [Aeromonas veronii]
MVSVLIRRVALFDDGHVPQVQLQEGIGAWIHHLVSGPEAVAAAGGLPWPWEWEDRGGKFVAVLQPPEASRRPGQRQPRWCGIWSAG